MSESAIKKIRIVLKMFSAALIAMAVIYAVLMVGVRLFGIKVYTVLSGSMEPTYKTGSVIYVVNADEGELACGDPITFKLSGGTVVTHRIVEIVNDSGKLMYRTQGDANDIPDGSLVNPDDVIGKAVFNIPYLGFVSDYIQKPPGLYVLIVSAAAVVFMSYISDELKKETDKDKNDDKLQQNTEDKQ